MNDPLGYFLIEQELFFKKLYSVGVCQDDAITEEFFNLFIESTFF